MLWRDFVRQLFDSGFTFSNTIGFSWPSEQFTFRIIDFAILFELRFDIGEHQCEGLARPAVCCGAILSTALLVSRITCQMKSAQAFDSENFSFAQKLTRFQNSG